MPKITIASRQLQADSDQCLLDSLLNQGERIPHSCRSGVCHACMLQADKGQPPAQSQQFLPREKINSQHFLACQCYPIADMTVSLPKSKPISAIITAIEKPESTLAVLTLAPRQPLSYLPGQHLTVSANERLSKDCYLASSPTAQQLTLYIRRKVGDPFSTWSHEIARVGDKIHLGQPKGVGIDFESMRNKLQLICHENHLAPVVSIIKHYCQLRPESEVILNCFFTGSEKPDIKRFFQDMTARYNNFSFRFLRYSTTKQITGIVSEASSGELIISGNRNFIANIEKTNIDTSQALKLLPIKERTLR